MKPSGMDGENHFSGISAPLIQTATIMLTSVTSKGVSTDARYHLGAKRHSSERLNSRRKSSFPRVIRVTKLAANRDAGIPRRTRSPPSSLGSYENGMSNNLPIPN